MAEQNQQVSKPSEQKTPEKKKSKKIQDNKPLLAIVILVTLIMLSAIGVGTYALIDSITNKDKDTEQTDGTEDAEENAENESEEADAAADEAEEQADEAEDATEEANDEQEEATEAAQDADSEESEAEAEEARLAEEERLRQEEEARVAQEEADREAEEARIASEAAQAEEDAQNEAEDAEDEENTEDSEDDGEDTEDSEENGSVEANGSVSTAASTMGLSVSGKAKSDANKANIAATGVWSATDYVKGDVVDKMYTVQLGDTLWEISEGFYGDAYQYTRIQGENSPKIGYLADGSQALIIPGEVLVLP